MNVLPRSVADLERALRMTKAQKKEAVQKTRNQVNRSPPNGSKLLFEFWDDPCTAASALQHTSGSSQKAGQVCGV